MLKPLIRTWNPGVRTTIFIVATGVMLAALCVFAVRRRLRGWPALGLALFVAGGLSNWIDRVTRGTVVDFLNVGVGPVRTGVFNVADVAIMIGAALFAWGEFAGSRRTVETSNSEAAMRREVPPTADAKTDGALGSKRP